MINKETRKLFSFLSGFTRLVIVGLGNPLRGDDGVGLLIHDALKERLVGRDDIVFVRAETVLENFIGPIQKAEPSHILLLDAVVSNEHQPGEWMLLEPENMETSFDSTHTLPFSLFADMMGERCTIKGIGIAAGTFHFGTELSQPVQSAIGEMRDVLVQMLGS